jgi:phage FluMu gp28-like protein
MPYLEDKGVARKHLHNFLRYFVITQDEHDEGKPFKKLPYDVMPHLRCLADLWMDNQLLCVAKSRQLMATWLFCAILLWDAMFKKGRLNIIINKREDDADETIDRVRFIYENLPEMIKNHIPLNRTPQGQLGSYCKLEFGTQNSIIRGLPQNPDAVRKNTASNLFMDEAAFIEGAEQCYTAALPTVRGGGKLIIVSTPCGRNFFHRIFSDTL